LEAVRGNRFRAVIDERMEEEVRVTVIATGFDQRVSRKDHSNKVDLDIKPFSNVDDLDIPAFLRRR
jgi:cell division protein FtsZ